MWFAIGESLISEAVAIGENISLVRRIRMSRPLSCTSSGAFRSQFDPSFTTSIMPLSEFDDFIDRWCDALVKEDRALKVVDLGVMLLREFGVRRAASPIPSSLF